MLSGITVPCAAREIQRIDAEWRFLHGDAPDAMQAGFEDASWRTITLPHDWSIEQATDPTATSAGGGGFFPTGIGWYRHRFVASRHWNGQQVALEFEGVYRNAEVWLNGARLGQHAYGYTPFRFDLTPHLKIGAENIIAVRVDNSAQPNSRWYSGSGIHRPVWLHVFDPVHIAADGLFVSTWDISGVLATTDVRASVQNESSVAREITVDISLIDPAGLPIANTSVSATVAPGATFAARPKLAVPHPRLWSPDDPALYRAVARVFADGGRLADRVETTFGIRTIGVSAARGFELNGRPLELVGGNVHHDNGPLGAAAFDRAEARKVGLLRAAGFNAVRTAHNPPSRAFLEACDRLGVLVIDEAFDGWARAKLKHDYSEVFAASWPTDLAAMVQRDRNHPSVVMWSIGNEVYERGAASGAELAAAMRALIRPLDDTRPITAGINGLGATGDWTRLDPLFASLDAAGYNYEIKRHADDHARLPSRVMFAAESYQSETFVNWAAAHDHTHVLGDFVWTVLDYLGEAGIGRVFPPDEPSRPHWEGNHHPWHGAACGDIDLTGWRKPVSHYRNIVWDRGEKLYAAVRVPPPGAAGANWNVSAWAMPPALPNWTWPGRERQELTVEVYSRHDAVRLYLNDRLLGEAPTTRAEEFRATFVVPYSPGTLTVAGLANGEEVERFTLQTAGAAREIRLHADRATLRADGQDLAFVVVEITDDDGRRRFDAAHAIAYQLSSPGVIAGIASADLATTETYQANPRRVHEGRALVVVRTTDAPGVIKLTASHADLEDATIAIEAR